MDTLFQSSRSSQRVDLKLKSTYKEIVDGQQRSSAILDFFSDKFALSKKLDTVEVAGKTYTALPDDYKARFLNYSLAADIYVGASSEMIQEVFRRINSYTVPLNAEENRHATFQGEFKWFVYRLSKKNDSILSRLGVFGEKQFVRMADTKLYTEIVHALVNGIKTTRRVDFNSMYKQFDDVFKHEKEFTERLNSALKRLDAWEALHDSSLMKHYNVYALALAITHLSSPVSALNNTWPNKKAIAINDATAQQKLSELADVLDDMDGHKDDAFTPFIKANSAKTNVESHRKMRFLWFCRVLPPLSVGDVYVSSCKRVAYALFSAQRRSRALFWL